ncbi:MAG: hypothetical protein ACOYBJ_03380 [Patescibacteria group bacterium]|jgi:hypothetical protein
MSTAKQIQLSEARILLGLMLFALTLVLTSCGYRIVVTNGSYETSGPAIQQAVVADDQRTTQ